MENNHYKTMSESGNVMFFTWAGRGGEPKSADDLRRYGRHLATYFPVENEWYKTKITRPETFKKLM